MGSDTLDTMEGIDVLVKNDLVTGGGTLARDDSGVGQEEFPNLRL